MVSMKNQARPIFVCPQCHKENRVEARFCANCRLDLAVYSRPVLTTSPTPPAEPATTAGRQSREGVGQTLKELWSKLVGMLSDEKQEDLEGATMPAPGYTPKQMPDTQLLSPNTLVSTKRMLRQSAGIATDAGRQRELNQDFVAALNYSLSQLGNEAPLGLYIIADGMGGHAAGEKASKSSARQAFLKLLESRILPDLRGNTRRLDRDDSPEVTLRSLVEQANQLIFHNRQITHTDQGTTITAALIIGNKATIANVGDSRAYLFRQGRLQQITNDHSIVYNLMLAGAIQREEIYTHPQKSQIYRSLGNRAEVEVDIFSESLQRGDRLLLCSDGLWEMVRDSKIEQILNDWTMPQTVCDLLIEAANTNGGEDNISVIVIGIE